MRVFIWKLCNLFLVCGILFGYQQFALQHEKEVSAYEKEAEAAKKAWAEAGKNGNELRYRDGTYQGSGTGFGGEIVVQIVIKEKAIQKVEVLSAKDETPDYLTSAKKLLDDIVSKQTVEVDTVSGATLSSNGILEGAKNALEQAKAAQ